MNLSAFLPDIYLEAPGCPEAMAMHALRNALREFCEETNVWQADLGSISLLRGQPAYDIDVPVDAELVMVLSARYNETTIDNIYTPEEMDGLSPTWRTDSGVGISYLVQEWNTVRVSPVPSSDDAHPIYLRVALKTTLTGSSCGDILDQWRDGIAGGALARLKRMAGQPWSDREGVLECLDRFERAKRKARVRVISGFNQRETQVLPARYT